MYHSNFGKLGQLRFPKPEDYYRFLGYLAHADIKVVYEYNEDTGSWGNAGRICFYTSRVPRNWGKITYREGRGDSMWYRINCNDFVENIVTDHGFTYGGYQDVEAIRETIPANYLQYFDEGYNW